MFERFTDGGRRLIVLAQEESRLLNHNYIGTEHLLLGFAADNPVSQDDTVKATLAVFKVTHEQLKQAVLSVTPEGQQAPSGHIPFTPRAKRVLELGLREALQLGDNYIAERHLFLGLLRDAMNNNDGAGSVAGKVLAELCGSLQDVRSTLISILNGSFDPSRPPSQDRQVTVRKLAAKAGSTRLLVNVNYELDPATLNLLTARIVRDLSGR